MKMSDEKMIDVMSDGMNDENDGIHETDHHVVNPQVGLRRAEVDLDFAGKLRAGACFQLMHRSVLPGPVEEDEVLMLGGGLVVASGLMEV